jgi:hypothetical protein
MKYETEYIKTKEELKPFLNSLNANENQVISVTLDPADGTYVVVYKKPKEQLLNE